jgi:hypothetical protein
MDERVYLAGEEIAPDTAPPVRGVVMIIPSRGTVFARVHDNRTPYASYDWSGVEVTWNGGISAMTWYGENLFRSTTRLNPHRVTVCATDRAGNRTCTTQSTSTCT